MKIVYLCGAYTHPERVVMEDRRIRALWLGQQVESAGRFVAFVPHAHILEPRAPSAREVWRLAMRKCIAHLRRSHFILPMEGWEGSRGARIEVWLCRRRAGFPKIVHSIAHLVQEADNGR